VPGLSMPGLVNAWTHTAVVYIIPAVGAYMPTDGRVTQPQLEM